MDGQFYPFQSESTNQTNSVVSEHKWNLIIAKNEIKSMKNILPTARNRLIEINQKKNEIDRKLTEWNTNLDRLKQEKMSAEMKARHIVQDVLPKKEGRTRDKEFDEESWDHRSHAHISYTTSPKVCDHWASVLGEAKFSKD